MEENKITNEEVTEEVKIEESVIEEAPEAEAPAAEEPAAEEPAAEEPAAEEPAAEEPKADADPEKFANELVEKLKGMIEEGNVTRVRVRKGENIILNLPVNVGLIGTAIGLIAAPWAVILGAVSAVGFKCTVEVEKKDGTVTVVYGQKE